MALRSPAWKSALVLGTLALPLAAQSPRPDEKIAEDLLDLLNTPVTGASKREQRLIDSPQAIEVITGDELRQMGVYRLQDALKLMTSLDLLEADNGFSVVGLRGVMQEGQPRTVQVLVDGVAMYNPLGGPVDISNLPVPVEAIERVEIVRGPSSTLYGANAVVGVIAITTRQGGASGGYVRGSRADKGTSRSGGVASLAQGPWSVLGSYQGYAMGASGFDTHYLGRPSQLRSYQDAPTSLSPAANPWVGSDAGHGAQAFGSVGYKAGDTSAWMRIGAASKWNGPESFFAYRKSENRFAQAGWRQSWSPTFATEVRAHRLELTNDLSAAPYLALAFEDPGFLGEYRWVDESISQVEIQANWEASASLHLVFGADTRELKVGNAPFVGIPHGAQERASGGFATLDWNLAAGWALTAGVRVENESLGGSRLSPRLAVVWNPDPNSALRLGYFTSTRSPQVLEQRVDLRLFAGRFYPSTANPVPPNIPVYARLLPNPDLKPEKTVNLELGYRHTFGRVTLDATLYRMQLTSQVNQVALDPFVEAIETRPPGVGQVYTARLNVPNQFRNAGDATNTGLEVALTWQVAKGWQAGCNGAWQRFVKDEIRPGDPMGDRFAYTPTSKANAWLRVKEGRLSGYLALQHVGATTAEALQAQGNPFFEARPAFLQVHGQVGWDLWKGSQVAVYVRNGAKAFTLQGATGPERPTAYQAARREVGLTLGWQF